MSFNGKEGEKRRDKTKETIEKVRTSNVDGSVNSNVDSL